MSTLINTDKEYLNWIKNIVSRFRQSQIKAVVKVNSELLGFYWSLGKEIAEKEALSKWGESFYDTLSSDLCSKLPDVKCFSSKNLRYVKHFYTLYSQAVINFPQLEGKIEGAIFSIPWGHHKVIIDKFRKNPLKALFFVQKTIENNWSRALLLNFVDTDLYERSGKAITNFTSTLPSTQGELAQELTKDPYNFNFLTLDEHYNEKDLKDALVANVSKFLIELGTGFAFMGREYRIVAGEKEQFIDLLFYNTVAHCYVVIEVKITEFEAAHLGQLSSYVSCVNHLLKKDGDNPTVGLLICKSKDNIFAQYSLEGYNQPLDISGFEGVNLLPDDYKKTLPSIEDIENEFKD